MKIFNKFKKSVNRKGTAKQTQEMVIRVDRLPEDAPIRKLLKNRSGK